MSERARALLINALVFPGMGQLLVLRRRLVGGVLVAGSLAVLLGLSRAFIMQWLTLLPAAPGDLLRESPWLLVATLLEVVRQPAAELWFWLVALAGFWLAALADGLVAAVRPEGESR